MAFKSEFRGAIEHVQLRLQTLPHESDTLAACGCELVLLGTEIVSDLEAEFDALIEQSKPSAA